MLKAIDVLVVGAGISGCAVALAIAKKNIPVTILTSSLDQRIYHSSFIKMDELEDHLKTLKDLCKQMGCPRATEQLMQLAKKSIDELVESHLLVDRFGNIDIHRCFLDQLKQMPQVKWLDHHSAIELLTLDNHSVRKSDVYKKPTCLGIYAYNHETDQVEEVLAKETILATGGATSLFPYTTNGPSATGNGLAMAYRAGARLLNLDKIQFHALALVSKDKPCIPLPLELLREGGKLLTSKNGAIELNYDFNLEHDLAASLYREMVNSKSEHLLLDLSILDPMLIKEKYPFVDSWCLNYGYNLAKDCIPVAPVAHFTKGGVAVDLVGQSSLQRLRAIGEVSCTGLFYDYRDEAMSVLESLTWAVACAEDITKQISKFIYYFPEMRRWDRELDSSEKGLQGDWHLMQQIMWHYAGLGRNEQTLWKGYHLLQRMKLNHEHEEANEFSIQKMHLGSALEAALLIAKSSLEKAKNEVAVGISRNKN